MKNPHWDRRWPDDLNFPLLATQTIPTRELSPEQRLIEAVLLEALGLLINRTNAVKNTFQSDRLRAREWVESHDTRYLMSFENCCLVLGVNVERIRLLVSRSTIGHLTRQKGKRSRMRVL